MKRHEYILRSDAVRANCIAKLRGLSLDKPVRVTIERYRKRRTLAQNRLMWAYLSLIAEAVADHVGEDEPEVIHEYFKARFCPPQAVEVAGEWVETRSTKTLSTAQMGAYLDAIYRWSVENLGLILPTPGLFIENNGDVAKLEEVMTNAE